MSAADEAISQAAPTRASDTRDRSFVNIPQPSPLPRNRWGRALQSVRELATEPNSPNKAIEVFYAISMGEFEEWFQRFLDEPDGRELVARRPQLGEFLCDANALAAMPEGSFGRAFAAFITQNDLDPDGVLQLNDQARRAVGCPELDPVRIWFRDRIVFSHDIAHVLTGYGMDGPGETRLLAFALGQYGGRSYKLVTLAAALKSWRGEGVGWPVELKRAWRLGQRARWLPTLPLEELLREPLEYARRAAGIFQ